MTDALIYLFLLSAFVGVGASYGPVYLSHIVLVAVAGAGLVDIARQRGLSALPKLPSNLHLFPWMMIGWYAATVLWSPNLGASIRYIFYLVYGACIATGVVLYGRDSGRLSLLVKSLMIVLCVEMFLGLLESFTEFRYPISPQSPLAPFFGRQMLLEPWAIQAKTLETVTSYPAGFRWNPNNLAATLNVFLPFFLAHRRIWVKLLGAGTVLVLVVMASSRINLAAWLAITAIYLLFFSRLRGLNTTLAVLTLAIAFLTVPLARQTWEVHLPLTFDEAVHSWQAFKRFFSDEGLIGDSVGLRRLYLQNGLAAITNSYGLGVGAGCSGEADLQPGAVEAEANRASLHNFWMEIAVEGGILFFFFFCLWHLYIIRLLLRLRTREKSRTNRYLSTASALSLIGLVPGAMGASSVVYEPCLWLAYGIALASINLGLNKAPGASAA